MTVRFLAAFALAVGLGVTAQAATIPVTDQASFNAARQAAKCGDVIEIDGAVFPVVPYFEIKGGAACPDAPRVIQPKPGTVAKLSGVYFAWNGFSRTDARFKNANGWILRGFKAPPTAFPSTVGGGYAGDTLSVLIFSADNITVDGLDMRLGDCSPGGVRARQGLTSKGVTVRSSRNVLVQSNRICGTWGGIDFLANDGLQILDNQIDDVFTDPIKGWSQRLTISGNSMERQWVVPDANGTLQHPDCIQLWTSGVKVRVIGVTITDNYCSRGAVEAAGFQGINLRDEARVGYEQVLVARNVVIGGDYANCISVGGAREPVVTDNACYSSRGAGPSKVMIRDGYGGTVLRNRANLIQSYKMLAPVALPLSGPDANVAVPISKYPANLAGRIFQDGNAHR